MWRIANNFIHDTCTGLWAASVIVLYALRTQADGIPAEAVRAIAQTQSLIWLLMLVSLLGLSVTGAIRLFYWRSQASAEELALKRRMLVVKHIAFVVVYGVGSVWAHSLFVSNGGG